MNRLLVATAAFLLALPVQANFRVNDQDNFIWDCYQPYWYLSNGTNDAWDGMFYLNINNVRFSNAQMQTELNGRGTRSGEVVMGSLRVQRAFWVPTSNPNANMRNYGRYLTIIRNPTQQDQTVNVLINGNLGSDSGTVSTGSSDGDANFENTDTWVATDDASNGGGDPSLAYVFQDENARHRIGSIIRNRDNMSFTWNNVTVPASGQVTMLFFVIQDRNREASFEEARALVQLPDAVLEGLADSERATLINFASNAPPTWDELDPVDVFVGQQVRLRIGVAEPDDDELEITVDGLPRGATYQALASKLRWTPSLDQIGEHEIRFHAVEVREDGEDPLEDETTVHITVHEMNRPPSFTTEPELEIAQGERWAYRPAGTDLESPDDLTLELVEGPDSMTLEEGELSWRAEEAPGMVIPVRLAFQDADGARAFQSFEIRVSVNRHAPVALVVQGDVDRGPGDVELDGTPSFDPNGGELFYHWRYVDGPPEAGQVEVNNLTQSVARTRPLKQGHYIFELIVNNGILSSRPAEFHVNVVNVSPVAVAGEDQATNLVAGDETDVSLDGSLSFDPNPEDVIDYEWTQVSGPVVHDLTGADSDRPSFIAKMPASYRFVLVVTDQHGNKSDPSVVAIDLVDPTPPVQPPPPVPADGCNTAPLSLWSALGLLFLCGPVRRRRLFN